MNDLKANEIYKKVISEDMVVFNDGTPYEKKPGYYRRMAEKELTRKIYALFWSTEQGAIAKSRVKDAISRMSNSSELQIEFSKEEHWINVRNGYFNANTGELELASEEMKFPYQWDFHYAPNAKLEDAKNFKNFLETAFPEDREVKTKLLLQSLGYGLSSFTKAKTGFFFLGVSNSGKSTILELLQGIMSDDVVSAIPLQRLSNRFNMARLAGKRVNICTEIDEHSLAALDSFKAMISNEVVTAEHKGKAPFEFRILCKSFNAGNMLPCIDKVEGMDAIINRMSILFFPVSISKEKQDFQLKEKLLAERDTIFSLALKELVELQKNNFVFAEPEDSRQVKEQLMTKAKVFEEFLDECCEKKPEARVHTITLYEMFLTYCKDNFIDAKLSKTQFSQKLYRELGVKRMKLRINGSRPLWGVEGLGIKEKGC